MAWLECPTRYDLPAYKYNIQLEGTTYGLTFTFNDRANLWTIDLSDASGNGLIVGEPVVVSWNLFGRFVAANLPPGKFYAFDTSGAGLDPGRFDLGDRVRLLYRESTTT